jgi:hypothetical protein
MKKNYLLQLNLLMAYEVVCSDVNVLKTLIQEVREEIPPAMEIKLYEVMEK